MVRLSPRKAGSAWSKINKVKVRKLERAGRMTSAGRARIEAAKKDGSWVILDDVEAGIVPNDFDAALTKKARKHFDSLTHAQRKTFLWHIKSAKRAATRERRIADAVECLKLGLKAPQKLR